MMSRLAGIFALALALVPPQQPTFALPLEPVRSGQESSIHRAVFADGRLWLLSDAGMLFSIAEGASDRVNVPLPEPARDLWVHDGQPAVITCAREICTDWTLRERTAGQWAVRATVASEGDWLIAVAAAGTNLTLLTSRRIIEIAGDKQSVTRLSGALHRRPIAAVHVTPTLVFVGFNAGEWGGGLQRIDRRTGAVTTIERNDSGDLCGGPLNTECDPVTGVESLPWKEDCAVATVGLVHFFASGRIVEICDDTARRLYVRPASAWAFFDMTRWGDRAFSSVAFFGVARRGNKLLAVGTDGIYRIRPGGAEPRTPLPTFKQIGGMSVSFDLPDVVLVLTSINQRLSLSGRTPMLVPR